MSLLRSLARRAVQPAASTLRPRVASRFETEVAPARLVEEHLETEARPAPATRAAPASSAAERPATATPLARATEAAATPAGPRAELAPIAPIAPVSPAPEPAPMALAWPTLTMPAPTSQVTPATINLATPSPPAAPLLPAASTLLIEHATERVIERHVTETRLVAQDAARAEAPTSAPRMEPTTLRPVVAPARPEPPAVALAPREAPAIRVTIDRIDVRAVHASPAAPAAPPSAAPPRAPALSLDDYLARRAAP